MGYYPHPAPHPPFFAQALPSVREGSGVALRLGRQVSELYRCSERNQMDLLQRHIWSRLTAAAAGQGEEEGVQPSSPLPVAPSAPSAPSPPPPVASSKKRKAAPSATPPAAAGSRPAEAEGSAPPPQSSQQCGRPGPHLPWPQPRLPSLSHLLMSDWVALHVSHPALRAEELLPLAAGGRGC